VTRKKEKKIENRLEEKKKLKKNKK